MDFNNDLKGQVNDDGLPDTCKDLPYTNPEVHAQTPETTGTCHELLSAIPASSMLLLHNYVRNFLAKVIMATASVVFLRLTPT